MKAAVVEHESSETGDGRTLDPECRHSIGNALLRLRDHLEDRPAHLLQRAALQLIQAGKVIIDVTRRHTTSMPMTGTVSRSGSRGTRSRRPVVQHLHGKDAIAILHGIRSWWR